MADVVKINNIDSHGRDRWLKWKRTSPSVLRDYEKKILSRVKSNIEQFTVPIFDNSSELNTIAIFKHVEQNNSLPILLIHGYCGGVGLWCRNLDAFAVHNTVFAFDLLGFGCSSRTNFSTDAFEIEKKWMDSIEEWRKHMNLDKFILLGHSLGGFLATSYALSHPERVAYLILADPWGFKKRPVGFKSSDHSSSTSFNTKLKQTLPHFSSLSILRTCGPFGKKILYKARQDLRAFFDQRSLMDFNNSVNTPNVHQHITDESNYEHVSLSENDDGGSLRREHSSTLHSSHSPSKRFAKFNNYDDLDGYVALDYIYHMNMRHPSGERAFNLLSDAGWPHNPMIQRVGQIDPTIPITFIYGSRTYMDMASGFHTQKMRSKSYVDIKIIEGAGHQVYVQAYKEFNSHVADILRRVNNNDAFVSIVKEEEEERDLLLSEDRDYSRRRKSNQKLNGLESLQSQFGRPILHLSEEASNEDSY